MSGDLLGTLTHWRERYGDMVHLRIWPEHQVIVTDPQLVRELLVDHHDDLIRWERGIAVFSQLHGNSVLIAEGEPWRTRRLAMQPSFTPKSVQSFVPVIAAASARALSQWRTDGADFPVETGFNALGMDVILLMMFSSEIDSDARLAEQAVHDVSVAANREMYWPASWPDWMPWKQSKRAALGILNRLVERHLQARMAVAPDLWPQDMLSRLLGMHRADPAGWSLKAVRDECMTTFLAGHETSADLVGMVHGSQPGCAGRCAARSGSGVAGQGANSTGLACAKISDDDVAGNAAPVSRRARAHVAPVSQAHHAGWLAIASAHDVLGARAPDASRRALVSGPAGFPARALWR